MNFSSTPIHGNFQLPACCQVQAQGSLPAHCTPHITTVDTGRTLHLPNLGFSRRTEQDSMHHHPLILTDMRSPRFALLWGGALASRPQARLSRREHAYPRLPRTEAKPTSTWHPTTPISTGSTGSLQTPYPTGERSPGRAVLSETQGSTLINSFQMYSTAHVEGGMTSARRPGCHEGDFEAGPNRRIPS